MLLSPIDHKCVKRDIRGDGIELWEDFANNINSSNYLFIASALGNNRTNVTRLFMYVFCHAASQLETLLRSDSGKLKGLSPQYASDKGLVRLFNSAFYCTEWGASGKTIR